MESFHHYLEREMSASITEDGEVSVNGKTFRTGVFPIGVDAKSFDSGIARHAGGRAAYRTLRESAGGKS